MKLKKIRSIKGGQFGVMFKERGPKDPHICLQIISEDDGNWAKQGSTFSAFWIDDMIDVLRAARETLNRKASKNRDKFGWRFRVWIQSKE